MYGTACLADVYDVQSNTCFQYTPYSGPILANHISRKLVAFGQKLKGSHIFLFFILINTEEEKNKGFFQKPFSLFPKVLYFIIIQCREITDKKEATIKARWWNPLRRYMPESLYKLNSTTLR